MSQTECGFTDSPTGSGSNLLTLVGPTLTVDIGFDPQHTLASTTAPTPGITGMEALVDTGAVESCIDNILAIALKLPVVDRRQISGAGGTQTVDIYQAQIHIPSLNKTILGTFAGVHLIAGGQRHQALIGRTFLRHYKMVYEGKTGKVTLSD